MKKALLLLLIPLILFTIPVILANQPYEYSLEVNTDHSIYTVGDSVKITGTLLSGGDPIENKDIGIQIITPLGMYHVNQIKTDANGYFEDTLKLKSDSLKGFYTVYVTNGHEIREISFEVVQNTKTLTINTNKETYNSNDVVAIAGTLYDTDTIPFEPIAIQIVNPNHGPVFLDQILTDNNGNYVASFTLPSYSISGQYKIFAAAKGVYSTKYFEVN